MNYIGCKYSLLPFLDESITKVVGNNADSFCDLFAGTGTVGSYFKRNGYQVIANDIQYYSYILNKHYIENNTFLSFNGLFDIIPQLKDTVIPKRGLIVCQYLDSLYGINGFVYGNFCLGGTQNKEYQRLYFTDDNGSRCDAIREKIDEWHIEKLITDNEFYFLLATLLENIDKVANTASVYGAFLKKIKTSASKRFLMNPVDVILSDKENKVYCEDANSLIRKIKTDILYLDPPYNQRQYSSNYHVLETIARNDKPILNGKTGMRNCKSQRSEFCLKNKATESLKDIIDNANAKYIFLSYNNEGIIPLEEIKKILSARGKYGVFTQKYNRFKADKDDARKYAADSTVEYIHYVECK